MNSASIQSPKIPVLGPYEAQCFSKYFKGIDSLLAKRFLFGFLPNEEHITSILCELLDERGSQLHQLPYSLLDLNNDLKKNGGLLHADVSISTTDYNKRQEHDLTQSDIGIVVEYRDNIEPNNSFSNGILLQAKKLFPASNSDYNLTSAYKSFDRVQHNRLEDLNKLYIDKGCGDECIKYLMYNPSLEAIPKHEQQKILYRQIKLDAKSIFDFTIGLQRYRELIEGEQSSILNLGCLFTSIENIHGLATKAAKASRTEQTLHEFTLGSLVDSINVYKSSLSYFFVFDLMMRGVGCSCEEFIKFVYSGTKTDIINKINELEVAPPKYSIKLKITAAGEQ
ncbi:hypothetical protein FD724_18515 [Nostoc sp. C057]|uniref:hypothetical protein n=1 Tax=Nostoc sp. C057 TaxID=2576903 RepID=UPI0015C326CD|nr:hypothetical protein [Nostoc sp. C057]QLE49884.1 hypothetical protein FD724_18515 [Nostoc sp. C057]